MYIAPNTLCIRNIFITDRTDIGRENRSVGHTCFGFKIISDIFELDRRMTLRKRAFPKYWPRSRAGDESAGTAVGTVPIYTPTSSRSYIMRKTTLPYSESPRTIYRDLPYSSGISIWVRKNMDRNRRVVQEKRCCLREIETSKLTLSARPFFLYSFATFLITTKTGSKK